MNPSATLR